MTIKQFGRRGYRVTLYERSPGCLYLRWWDSTKGRLVPEALKHGDWDRGEAAAKQKLAELLTGALQSRPGTLARLFALYERRRGPSKKSEAQRREDRRRSELWCAFLDGSRDPQTLTPDDLEGFIRARRAGTIRVPKRMLAPHPGDRTIDADLVYLHSVLNWAVTAREHPSDRRTLLEANPVRGVRVKVQHQQRPIASYDRFRLIRKHADQVDPQRLFGAFLDLVEALGWRVSAICTIWSSDLDLAKRKATPFGRLRKRGAVDKEGVEAWVPLSKGARTAINRILRRNPVVGDRPLFPSPRKAGQPWRRHHGRDLLERAEAAAGLAPIAGGDFHPYRRKWATERKHLPTPDVMAAGGWRDARSLEACYQLPDEETMYRVVTETRKLREAR